MKIGAETADQLLKLLAGIDITVPPRSERTTAQVERWSTARFLSTYARSALLSYPLQVTRRDRPDVLVAMPRAKVGIEITEAVPANWAKTSALHEEREYENLMFIPRCKPGEPPKSTQELDRIARGEDMGVPWEGDSPEREWADAMLHFTEAKAAKFSKPGFNVFDLNWLLIYDNWPAPVVDERKAAGFFLTKLKDRRGTRPFDAIFVEGNKHFWHFEGEQVHEAPINDVWKDS